MDGTWHGPLLQAGMVAGEMLPMVVGGPIRSPDGIDVRSK